MIIQNEYCNGGSLSDMINQYSSSGNIVHERDLKQILVQVAKVGNVASFAFQLSSIMRDWGIVEICVTREQIEQPF